MAERVAELEIGISVKDQATGAYLRGLEQQLTKLNTQAGTATQGMRRYGDAKQRAANDALRLAQAEARNLTVLGNQQGAYTRLQAGINQYRLAMDSTVASRVRLTQAETQAERIQQRLSGNYTSLRASIGNLIGNVQSLAAAYGVLQLAQAGITAVNLANEAERTQTSITGLAGSTERYNRILALARQQQLAFGGSLQANLEPFRDLTLVSNKTGASLEQLLKTSQQLQFIRPAEGLEGASFALGELASGDITSLAERFNLTRDSLNELKNSGLPFEEQLIRLSALLDQQGASLDNVTALSETNAASWARLGGAITDFATTAGAAISGTLAPAAEQAAATLQTMEQALTISVGQQITDLNVTLLEGAATFQEYTAQVQFARDEFGLLALVYPQQVAAIGELSEAQFNYAQSLVKTGTASAQAVELAQNMRDEFILIGEAQAAFTAQGELTTGQIDQVSNAMLNLIATSDEYEGVIAALIQQLQDEKLTSEQVTHAIFEMARANEDASASEEVLTTATQDATVALEQQAAEALLNQVQTEQLTLAKAQLEATARAEAEALLAAGANGQAAAAQLAASSSLVDQLTAAFYRLAVARQEAAGGGAGGSGVGVNSPNALRRSRDQARQFALLKQESDQRAKVQKATEDQQIALGGVNDKLDIERKRLERLVPETEAYIRQQTRVLQLEQQAARSSGSGGRSSGGGAGGSTKLTDQQKLNNQLLLDQQKYQQQAEDELTDHLENQLAINEEFAEKFQAAREQFYATDLDSQLSFYEQLGRITDQGLAQQLAAEFEAARLRAQQLDPQIADDYLTATEQALTKQARRQEEITNALADGDNARAEYLEGLARLEQNRDQFRIDQALSGETLEQERLAALADESARYGDEIEKLGITAERSADRRIEKARIEGQAIEENIAKLERLGQTYQHVNPNVLDRAAPDSQRARPSVPQQQPITIETESFATVHEGLESVRDTLSVLLSQLIGEQQRTTSATDRVASRVGNLAQSSRRPY